MANLKMSLLIYVIKNEICYFKYSPLGDYLKNFLHDFEPKIRNFELNVPTPFKVGDVVMFDGYPFAQKRFSLILSTGDNQDCCSLWNLYWAGPRTWKTGAVKHGDVGYILRNDFIVPPLYYAKRYDGVLPSTFKIFHEIKQAFGDDEQKYYDLDSFVSAREITEDEIQNFIDEIWAQCEMGISRSAGIAAAISEHFELDSTDIMNNKKYIPNMLCYNLTKEAFSKKEVQI